MDEPKSRRPLVLGYHAVSNTWQSPLAVTEHRLRAHAGYLKSRGYVGLTLSEAERRRTESTLPRRCVVMTFDDGYASTTRAAEILDEVGYPGTVFVVTAFVDSGEPLAWHGIEQWLASDREELRSLSWSDAQELATRGWEIGSHTETHPLLSALGDDRLRHELGRSRIDIEQRLGRCTAVAYPYGLADGRVADAARTAGYDVGCTLTWAHTVDEPHRRPRTGMDAATGRLRTALRLSWLGQGVRRTEAARIARLVRRRRTWIPDDRG